MDGEGHVARAELGTEPARASQLGGCRGVPVPPQSSSKMAGMLGLKLIKGLVRATEKSR